MSQNNSVKAPDSRPIYYEGDFYSRDQIREILDTRKKHKLSRIKAYRHRRRNKKRKPILMFGLNTIKA